MPEITKEQLEELESHSIMLGQIAAFVEDFCEDENDTTLVGVVVLLAKYHQLESDRLYHMIDEWKKNP